MIRTGDQISYYVSLFQASFALPGKLMHNNFKIGGCCGKSAGRAPPSEQFHSVETAPIESTASGYGEETKVTKYVNTSYDEDGNKIVNEFLVLKTLGKGQYGKVKLAVHVQDNSLYAIKVMKKSKLRRIRTGPGRNAFMSSLREIAIWKKLRHKNVVRLYEVMDDEDQDKLFLVSEFVENGSIASLDTEGNLIGPPMKEDLARRYMRDIISGLAYLHEQKILHRDIKPENILLGIGGTKLADFGVSHMYEGDDDGLRATDGTPAFLCPEACGEGKFGGKKADIWALGVTLYILLVGHTPFQGGSYVDMYESIKRHDPYIPETLSVESADLLRRFLDKRPDSRITLEGVMAHPWITGKEGPIRENPHDIVSVSDNEISVAVSRGKKLQNAGGLSTVVWLKTNLSRLKKRKSKEAECDGRSNSASLLDS